MPTLSASDYTQFLKFKAAAATPIRPAIQTRDNATLSQSVLNANILASQAAYVVTPTLQVIGSDARVVGQPVVQTRSTPDAKSTLSWTSGTSGAVSSTTSSKFQQAGGLPAKNVVGTYTRLPQNAGWIQGGRAMLSSGPKRF
jgi:hypothetical protein